MFTVDGVLQSRVDVIDDYLETRYVGSPEAVWRLMKLPLHMKSHAIQRLSVHKDAEKRVMYEEGNEEEAIAKADGCITTLEAFFIVNQNCRDNRSRPPDPHDVEDSRNYFYPEMPLYFVFRRKNGWKPRKQRRGKTLGRMYFVSPRDSERYYLRMLLLHCKGPSSFLDLKTVDRILRKFQGRSQRSRPYC